MMTIGDPADKKSPGSRPMLEPLKGIEASDRPRFAQEKLAFEAKNAVWAAAKTAFLKSVSEGEGLMENDTAGRLPPEPDEPVPVKITVNDITSQALVESAAGRPRGLLCYLDEMNGWVNKLVSPQSGEDRSCWVVCYESERYEMDRVKRGAIHADNLAVAIYGNMQPRVLKANFSKLTSDGLLQRFLPAVVRHEHTRLGNPVPEFMTSAERWENLLRSTFAMPPMNYKLSPEAYQMFRRFQMWYEGQKTDERLLRSSDTFLTAFGKLEGLAGRLILLFHAVEAPFSPMVDKSIVHRVTRIIRKFVIPMYRYLFEDETATEFDKWLMDHVIHHCDVGRLTLSEIKRSGRRQFDKMNITNNNQQNQMVINAMYTLEEHRWVMRTDDGSGEYKGQAEWALNPHLGDTFKDYRKAVVKAKKKILNEIKVNSDSNRTEVVRVHGEEILDDG